MKKQQTVLIVDDEGSILESIQDLLEAKGYLTQTANNGVEGLRILAEQQIDLVVLDLKMPRMDGYMFLEHQRERWEKSDKAFPFPKVLVMTAVDPKKDLGLSHNLGATEYMNKPFKSDDFLEAIKRLLK